MQTAVPSDRTASLALVHGAFYLATGVWPLVSIRSFEAVTGPKADCWLVRTVGVLVSAIGATLALAGHRRRVTPEIRLLGVGSAAALAAIDVVYVSRRRIPPVYLLDAAAEGALLVAWREKLAARDRLRQTCTGQSTIRALGRGE